MREVSDHWFIRFPDGRVLRAINTAAVRQQLAAGRIPRNSAVRRSPDDEWTALEGTREFADAAGPPVENGPVAAPRLAPFDDLAAGVSSRLDPTQFQTVGVRGMTHELLAAVDAALLRNKLTVAAGAGLLIGVVLALVQFAQWDFEAAAPSARWAAAGAALFTILTITAALLTNMTFVEASHLRPARRREARAGLTRLSLRLAIAWLLTMGVAAALIALLRWLPTFLMQQAGSELAGGYYLAAGAAALLGPVGEVVLWPVCGFALLLAPILVVERCSVAAALRHWLRLLRQDLGRVFVYEALALGLGAAAALLLAMPLVAVYLSPGDERLRPLVAFSAWVLTGLAAAPLLAYLIVANVFIYLNLRYETSRRR